MITPSGVEIPDPPQDPAERRRWKLQYYVYLYGRPLKDVLKEIAKK